MIGASLVTANKNIQNANVRRRTSDIYPQKENLTNDKNHLFDVEDKEVFDGTDGRHDWAVERADPADGLTVDDL